MTTSDSKASEEYAYLLLSLGTGLNHGQPLTMLKTAIDEVQASLSVQFWPITICYKSRDSKHQRLAFTFTGHRRDDAQAQHVAEAVLLAAFGLFTISTEIPEQFFAVPFRRSALDDPRVAPSDFPVKEAKSLMADAHKILFLESMILSYSSSGQEMTAKALRAAPVLVHNTRIRFASAFLSVARRDFHVYPGHLRDAIDEGDRVPAATSELARWESAFQNYYKCIEAITGDPPRDDRSFREKLTKMGVDPTEEVGYETKMPVASVLRLMNDIRDTRAAHGSSKRGITTNQMLEITALAELVLLTAIEQELGKPIDRWEIDTDSPEFDEDSTGEVSG
jgi:hypothetical protein